ncbi:DUF4328 domain-containing protein [Patulibacter sp.]|uniref:DUF4328 domain-containing protein n=1 Tax=Patulibacter sp. TaxID=1912859 RepID=UPI002720E5A4|nr:DUF4328 domain-containing protein [Patulibacter sp.]MDO9409667.1 DUF4328 domain-containing protein [Patulibacter sp.]
MDDPWARPPGTAAEHRPGNWGGDPVPGPAVEASTGPLVSPARRLRPARIAVVGAAILSLVEGLTSAWALWETRSVAGDEPGGGDTPLDGLTVSQDAIDRFNAVSGVDGVVAIIGVLALIVAAVFVIRWENVVLRNQRGLGVPRPRYAPVAAGFSWFVPIWSLFGPKRALNDAWRAAAPASEGRAGGDAWLVRAVPTLFTAWWATWLVGQIVGNGATRLTDDTLSGQTLLYGGSVVACVSTIVAGVLFVAVMERITARHDARIAEREAPAT